MPKQKQLKKKMTEGEGETDTQHFNSFIRLDSSCIPYTQRQKRFPGHMHILHTLYKDFIP